MQVNIRGPKDDVDKAKQLLVSLSNEKQLNSLTAEVRAKPEHHKFLIGRQGKITTKEISHWNTLISWISYQKRIYLIIINLQLPVGANIQSVRDKTGARIIFPNEKDKDRDVITILGTKEAVAQAKKELESRIKDLVSRFMAWILLVNHNLYGIITKLNRFFTHKIELGVSTLGLVPTSIN